VDHLHFGYITKSKKQWSVIFVVAKIHHFAIYKKSQATSLMETLWKKIPKIPKF
jgi:uncharacterized lipoprotein